MSSVFKTKEGTELPIIQLKGKDYLEVKYRVVWFREEHPTWAIETEFLRFEDKWACAKATIKDQAGRIISTSHKTEHVNSFHDFAEKAETGAVGRALALIGYGTQFCADDLDEGERIVDAPAKRTGQGSAKQSKSGAPSTSNKETTKERASPQKPFIVENPGDYVIKVTNKVKGKKICELTSNEVEYWTNTLTSTELKGEPWIEFRDNLLAFWDIGADVMADTHKESYPTL